MDVGVADVVIKNIFGVNNYVTDVGNIGRLLTLPTLIFFNVVNVTDGRSGGGAFVDAPMTD